MHTIPNVFKIPFFLAVENSFFPFIFIDKYFKFKEIEYFINYTKFEL